MNPIQIITHNGVFHTDEVFAIALIKSLFTELPVIVKRTRSAKVIRAAIIDSDVYLIDLGMIYDSTMKNFDHHQESYQGSRSSFGLLFKYLEKKIAAKFNIPRKGLSYFNNSLVKPIDWWDNNYNQIITKTKELSIYNLQHIISAFNSQNVFSEMQDKAFDNAVNLAQGIILRALKQTKEMVFETENIKLLLEKGEIKIMNNKAVSEVYFSLHKSWAKKNNIKYLFMPVPGRDQANYMIYNNAINEKLPSSKNQLFKHKNGHFILFESKEQACQYFNNLS